jgi:hypothetical protein
MGDDEHDAAVAAQRIAPDLTLPGHQAAAAAAEDDDGALGRSARIDAAP